MSAEQRKREIEAMLEESKLSCEAAFSVSRRIQELESYMQDPRYHNQCTNLEAIIKLYKLGELKYGTEFTIFAQGKIVSLDAIPPRSIEWNCEVPDQKYLTSFSWFSL